MIIKLKNKTGFIHFGKYVYIEDVNKNPFYFKQNKSGVHKFNLPPGVYFSNEKIYKLKKPVFYSYPQLPERYFFDFRPKKLKVFYSENPDKCTVELKNGIVIFDNEFKNAPKFIKDYILAHETGHYFYSGRGEQSEIDCDKFARLTLLKKGYNPSQLNTASFFTLGETKENVKRKLISFNDLTKTLSYA